MIDVRRLAAVDLVYLGPRVIITEFAVGALGCLALGVFAIVRSRTLATMLIGVYLVTLGLNYVPLLLAAIDLTRDGSAVSLIERETTERRALFRKYRRQTVWIL